MYANKIKRTKVCEIQWDWHRAGTATETETETDIPIDRQLRNSLAELKWLTDRPDRPNRATGRVEEALEIARKSRANVLGYFHIMLIAKAKLSVK